ncbi:unnamed protein product [Darwinula stevensoni]|uniref:non-specific serine/threonine protein kinase n=1 Tax=Darwinula stevensoni TaxID=69355 RepID=A0A7R8X775_9CRUS|nr:unnamed protein product [Darwinula stevensoni]CAG0882902.1 unnamed protein product [Darwinula stevensoni]
MVGHIAVDRKRVLVLPTAKKKIVTLRHPRGLLIIDDVGRQMQMALSVQEGVHRMIVTIKSCTTNFKNALGAPEHYTMVDDSFHMLYKSLEEALHLHSSWDVKMEIACTLGHLAYAVGNQLNRFLKWLMDHVKKRGSLKPIFIQPILELLKLERCEARLPGNYSVVIMQHLHSILEATEEPAVMVTTMDTVLFLLEMHPTALNPHFEDLADILVGWHIDTTQSSAIQEYIVSVFQMLHPYWLADLPFTLNLMTQFLEDMDCYSEQLLTSGSIADLEENSQECHIAKLTSLLRVFSTVVKSLGPLDPGIPSSMPIFQDVLRLVLRSTQPVFASNLWDLDFFVAVNEDIDLLVTHMLPDATWIPQISEYLQKVLNSSSPIITELLPSIAQLYSTVISKMGPDLNSDFLQFLEPEHGLHSWITHPSQKTIFFLSAGGPGSDVFGMLSGGGPSVGTLPKVLDLASHLLIAWNQPFVPDTSKIPSELVHEELPSVDCSPAIANCIILIWKCLVEMYKDILMVKSVTLLEEMYQLILQELEVCYQSLGLTGIQLSGHDIRKVPEEEAKTRALFYLTTLSGIGISKESVLGLWALQPSIFELLAVLLCPVLVSDSTVPSSVLEAQLAILSEHSQRHKHFISSSSLLSQSQLKIAGGPTSGEHFATILNILQALIQKVHLAHAVRITCLDWLEDLLEQGRGYSLQLTGIPQFMRLFLSLATLSLKLCLPAGGALHILQCLTTFVTHYLLPSGSVVDEEMETVAWLCLHHASSTVLEIQEGYLKLLFSIPLPHILLAQDQERLNMDIALLSSSQPNSKREEWIRQLSSLKLNSLLSERSIMKIASSSSCLLPQHFRYIWCFLIEGKHPNGESWLEEIFRSLGKHDEMMTGSVLHYRAAWELASFCIQSKLKCIFGKPNETLLTLENGVKQLLMSTTMGGLTLIRGKILLTFMDAFEKQLYNAAHGSAVALPTPSKNTKIFFWTNQGSCWSWLHRLRKPLITLSADCKIPSATTWHGYSYLAQINDSTDLKTGEFYYMLTMLVEALVQLHSSDSIQGLYDWLHEKYGLKLNWMKPAIAQAGERYETGAIEYWTSLEGIDEEHDAVKHFVLKQLEQCYVDLGSWEDLVSLRESLGSDAQSFKALLSLERHESSHVPPAIVENVIKEFETLKDFAYLQPLLQILAQEVTPLEQGNEHHGFRENEQHCMDLVKEHLHLLGPECWPELLIFGSFLCHLQKFSGSLCSQHESSFGPLSKIPLKILRLLTSVAHSFMNVPGIYGPKDGMNELLQVCSKRCRQTFNLNAVERFLSLQIAKSPATCLQAAKLLLLQGKLLEAQDTLCGVSEVLYGSREAEQEMGAKCLLTLGKWLQQPWMSEENSKGIWRTLVSSEDSPAMQYLPSAHKDIIGEKEMGSGLMFHLTTAVYPSVSTSWSHFANWAYQQGQRVLSAAISGQFSLEREYTDAIHAILDQSSSPLNPLDMIQAIESNIAIGLYQYEVFYNTNWILNDDSARTILLTRFESLNLEPQVLLRLLTIWKKAQQNLFHHYRIAAPAYFHFLQLHHQQGKEGAREERTRIHVTSATLHLLRLLVRHPRALESALDNGFASTPPSCWKKIIPQLFSHLSHSDAFVQQKVSDLLCQMALDSSHLIVFPALVGALSTHTRSLQQQQAFGVFGEKEEGADEDGEEGEDEFEIEDDDATQNAVIQNRYLSLIEALSKQDDSLVNEVRTLIRELRRLALLWEELWLGVVSQQLADLTSRASRLKSEVAGIQASKHLTRDEKEEIIRLKHSIAYKPVQFAITQLKQVTSIPPETTLEKKFHEKFGKLIEEVVKDLSCVERGSMPSLSSLRCLESGLKQHLHHRTTKGILLSQASPAVTIGGLENMVSILSTKTKPKKLIIHGSDGKKYSYLLKGLEDLHLDERIMQFLSIFNEMLLHAKHNERGMYKARNYSVIPLGPRSGLIQWVQGAVPLFGIYKRWQQRQLVSPREPSSGGGRVVGGVQRPSELFNAKLYPLLKEKGIPENSNRKEWPLSVLCQTLKSLLSDTPPDLLQKELWCHSVNSTTWWSVTKTFNITTAIMSMVGYVIGLGDRHLDNLLVDLTTGQVVHIDYNVCFEKGKHLRIPEKVPFRMTQNIQTALGITGCHGLFKNTCCFTLNLLRRHRGLLLSLLETFVYDPLVEWTPSAGENFNLTISTELFPRQELEELHANVSINMLYSLADALESLKKELEAWVRAQGSLEETDEQLQQWHQCLALLKEAEANPHHHLYQLSQRYSVFIDCEERQSRLHKQLETALEQENKMADSHLTALKALGDPETLERCASLKKKLDALSDSHGLIEEFLQQAGQLSLASQYGELEGELRRSLMHLHGMLGKCVEALHQYGLMISYSPWSLRVSPLSTHKVFWLCKLATDLSSKTCQEAILEFQSLEDTQRIQETKSTTVHIQLQLQVSKHNSLLHQALSEQGKNGSVVEEPLLSLKGLMGISSPYLKKTFCRLLIDSIWVHYPRSGLMEPALGGGFKGGEAEDIINHLLTVTELGSLGSLVDENPHLASILSSLQILYSLLSSLQDLLVNFITIIIPEALKQVMAEDPSLTKIVQCLNELVLHISSGTNTGSLDLGEMMTSYHALMETTASPNPGQMLLMGFNGLFDKVEKDLLFFNQEMVSLTLQDPPVSSIPNILSEILTEFPILVLQQLIPCLAQQEAALKDAQEEYQAESQQLSIIMCSIQKAIHCKNHSKCMEGKISCCQSILRRWQLTAMAYHWLSSPNTPELPLDAVFTVELKQSLEGVRTVLSTSIELQGKFSELVHSVQQRLKWASGANRNLSELATTYDGTVGEWVSMFTHWRHLAEHTIAVTSALLHLESMRDLRSQKQKEAREAWITLLHEALNVCLHVESTDVSVSSIEKAIIKVKPLHGGEILTVEWAQEASRGISGCIQSAQSQLDEARFTLSSNGKAIIAWVEKLKGLIRQHHKLVSKVRSLLKTLTKLESEELLREQALSYVSKYKNFSQLLASLLKQISSKDIGTASVPCYLEDLEVLASQVGGIYDGLLNLLKVEGNPRTEKDGLERKNKEKEKSPRKHQQFHLPLWEDLDSAPPPLFMHQHSEGLGLGEKESYPLQVFHRVRVKLEGRDPDPSYAAPVESQVEHLIEEATNIENLALLYEGWTAWV